MAWRLGIVPEEWKLAIIIQIYKIKAVRNYLRTKEELVCWVSLERHTGLVYGRMITEKVKKIKCRIGEETGWFIEGRGCMDQNFTLKIIKLWIQIYIAKKEKTGFWIYGSG